MNTSKTIEIDMTNLNKIINNLVKMKKKRVF